MVLTEIHQRCCFLQQSEGADEQQNAGLCHPVSKKSSFLFYRILSVFLRYVLKDFHEYISQL